MQSSKPLYWLDVLNSMEPISLEEMKSIELMNRVDTKYISTVKYLGPLLSLASENYRAQNVAGMPLSSYDTLYYDTEDMDMYLKHHNRKLRRQKIRTRTYVDSNLTFLEVKNKTNKGRTVKVRTKIDKSAFMHFQDDAQATDFVGKEGWYSVQGLTPSLRTSFKRITLVNREKTERITIDTVLRFENERTGITASAPQLMIIELKRDGSQPSAMEGYLRHLRIKNEKISKYCVGVALSNLSIKKNRFKGKTRLIKKITDVDFTNG